MGDINSKDNKRTDQRLIELLESEVRRHAETLKIHQTCLSNQTNQIDKLQRSLELQAQEIANLKASTATLRDSLEFLRDIVRNNMSNQNQNR